MRKLLRVLWRTVKWGALVVLVLIAIAFAVNARDERLSPEAEAMLRVPHNPYAPDQNIYVALLGFDAPAGQSVAAAGQEKIDYYNRRVEQTLSNPMFFAVQMPARPNALTMKCECESELAHPRDIEFWSWAREHESKINDLTDENRELLGRYRALQQLPGYFETERPSFLTDIAVPPTQVRTLYLANFAFLMQRGDLQRRRAAMADMGGDLKLWQRVFAGEGAMISKLVAAAYLQIDYLVLADMIADPKTAIPSDIDLYVPYPNDMSWNASNGFAAEYRVDAFIRKQSRSADPGAFLPTDTIGSRIKLWFARSVSGPVGLWFFKDNASENAAASTMNQLATLAELNPNTFNAQRAKAKELVRIQSDFLKASSVYNPIGKILEAIVVPAQEAYILRPYDTSALQRLLHLSLEIRRQQITYAAIPEFMRMHPEWSTHPADGRPFAWDATKGVIAIQTVAKQPSDRRFSVPIWRKAE